MSGDLMLAIRSAVRLGPALASDRAAAMAAVDSASSALSSVSDRINELMPPSVKRISSRVHTALMAAVVEATGWLDTSIVRNFVHGFPVVGDIPDSGVYRPLPVDAAAVNEAALRYASFQSSAAAWNRLQYRRLSLRTFASSSARAADLAVSVKTAEEVSKGVVVGPYKSIDALARAVQSVSPLMPLGTVPRPLVRFGITQKGKLRAVDNGRSNGANRATLMHETVTTPSFFFVAVASRAIVQAASSLGVPPPRVYTALADLSMAYRTVPTSQPWFTSVVFFDPRASPPGPRYFYLPGHNFGLLSAVVNFNRHPELVVVMARAFCSLAIDHYYDDFILVDTDRSGSGLRCLRAWIDLLGRGPRRRSAPVRAPELDPSKTQETSQVNVVLGITADTSGVRSGTMRFEPVPERIERILRDFRAAFERGVLTSGEAASLRGRLQFCLTAAYGCVGRAATLPLVQRQYRDTTDEFVDGSPLHHCLLFFEALLPRLPPLVVPLSFDSTPPLLVYTDAAFWLRRSGGGGSCEADRHSRLRGGLGVVVFDPADGTYRFAMDQPDWAELLSFWSPDHKTYIAQLEVLAAISAYFTYPELFVGRRVQHFIDNTVALSALVHGYSGKADLAKMVNAFFLQMAGLRASVYFDYVPSKANIADLPSRGERAALLRELRGLRPSPGARESLRVPHMGHWVAPLERWLTRNLHREGQWPA